MKLKTNERVKNNIEKFEGEDFMFQLTENEFENEVQKISPQLGQHQYLPNAFYGTRYLYAYDCIKGRTFD